MTKPGVTRPKRSPSKPGRIAFDVKAFDDLIADQGVFVRITPTLICPNISDLDTYNHSLSCNTCDNGIVDVASKAVETWAFIQSINKDKEFAEHGIWEMRDAQISFREVDMRVNYWYKIEVLDFTTPFNELIERKIGVTEDKTRYTPQEATTTKFYLIDKDGNEYVKDTDYQITANGIDWLVGGSKPADGTIYSFSYPMLPTYRVLDLMHNSRFYYDGNKRADLLPSHLPQQAHIRFDFLARNKGYEETNDDPPPPGSVSPPPFKTGFNG